VTAGGHALAGAKVTLYAWPRNSVVAALHQETSVPWTIVGSAVSNHAGLYAVTVSNPGTVRADGNWAANGSYVNFTVVARGDGHGDLYSFSAPQFLRAAGVCDSQQGKLPHRPAEARQS
jgi:hypothetical protein